MSEKAPRCDEWRSCRQTIHLKSRPSRPNQYVMTIEFTSHGPEQVVTSAFIYVVIRPSRHVKQAPRFVNTPSEFFLFKNSASQQRNASVFVSEADGMSLNSAGFHLDLLAPDMTPLSPASLFEVVPNYGLGFLPSMLRVKDNSSTIATNNQKYDLIVIFLFYINSVIFNVFLLFKIQIKISQLYK